MSEIVDRTVLVYVLGLIAEECGEATQLAGKALRFGYDTPGAPESPFNGMTARENLPKELGDIRAAIRFGAEHGLIDLDEVAYWEDMKFAKLMSPHSKTNTGAPLAPRPTPATSA